MEFMEAHNSKRSSPQDACVHGGVQHGHVEAGSRLAKEAPRRQPRKEADPPRKQAESRGIWACCLGTKPSNSF